MWPSPAQTSPRSPEGFHAQQHPLAELRTGKPGQSDSALPTRPSGAQQFSPAHRRSRPTVCDDRDGGTRAKYRYGNLLWISHCSSSRCLITRLLWLARLYNRLNSGCTTGSRVKSTLRLYSVATVPRSEPPPSIPPGIGQVIRRHVTSHPAEATARESRPGRRAET